MVGKLSPRNQSLNALTLLHDAIHSSCWRCRYANFHQLRDTTVQLVLEVKDCPRTGARQMGWATSLAGLLGIGFDELGDLLLAAIPLIVWMAVGILGFRNGIFWKP